MVRVEETIRQLERQRDAMRDVVERRREAAADRLRQLDSGSAPGGSDRALRALERSLKDIQRDLAEVRREVRRLRGERNR
jgi:hypothetical protein